MKKKMIEINHEVVDEKSRIIGSLIDGLRLPEVFGIIGTIVINIILSTHSQFEGDMRTLIVDWLENLAKQVRDIDFDEPERESKLN